MKLRNWLLRKLAERELIQWKTDFYTEDEKNYIDWKKEQLEKLVAGDDIDPPWIINNPGMSPWELRHDYWLINVWLPFWRKLTEEKRQTYREKWNMPDDWDEVVTRHWTDID